MEKNNKLEKIPIEEVYKLLYADYTALKAHNAELNEVLHRRNVQINCFKQTLRLILGEKALNDFYQKVNNKIKTILQ